jgi:hypothetical protein
VPGRPERMAAGVDEQLGTGADRRFVHGDSVSRRDLRGKR